eukprot:TRINITY_DN7761_c0_g1_i1.p1 TRINITY_DN7761_c0_g1~~TRINITY_DN7761_c0_g1_i1.p1  ORF type:complete len:105 (-),score=38.71 TRINITY_DN7761_c0_g1_i1:66-380(-)
MWRLSWRIQEDGSSVMQYTVDLKMDDACTSIGLELQKGYKVKSLQDNCLVSKYNADAGNKTKVAVGDKLIAFNGVTTEIIKEIKAHYERKQVGSAMTLQFERAA